MARPQPEKPKPVAPKTPPKADARNVVLNKEGGERAKIRKLALKEGGERAKVRMLARRALFKKGLSERRAARKQAEADVSAALAKVGVSHG